MNPKISIIVPIYKVEAYINKCVDSIIKQTYKDFELILVDDGSPDNCGQICDEYAKNDSRIKVIHKENGGLSSARNAGIDIARGEYIGFIDSDDYINEKMYEVLFNTAVFHSSDMVVCDFVKVGEGQLPSFKKNARKGNSLLHFTNMEALNQLYLIEAGTYMTGAGNNVKWIIVCNKLFKRSLFKELKFTEGRICEDEFITHELLYKSKQVTYVPQEFYYYVQRKNSIINTTFSIKRFDKVYALKERADFFRKLNQKQLHDQAIKSYVEAFFWNYYKAKKELLNVKRELKGLKYTLNGSLISLLKNSLLGWKQKVAITLFVINPFFFEKITKFEMKS